jgi:hypothetical protein
MPNTFSFKKNKKKQKNLTMVLRRRRRKRRRRVYLFTSCTKRSHLGCLPSHSSNGLIAIIHQAISTCPYKYKKWPKNPKISFFFFFFFDLKYSTKV